MLRVFKSAIDSLGFINGVFYLIGRAMQALSGGRCRLIRYYLVAQPIHTPFVPACRASSLEAVHQVVKGDSLVGMFPRPDAVLESRFERGHVCLAAESKGVFAGFLWYAQGHYDEDEVHCRFVLDDPKMGVWDYDVHVEPRYRMGRTFARLWDAANERLAAAGVLWSFSRISAFNRQSLLSHQRLGIRKLESMTFFCFGPLQIALFSCKPYINLSWNGVGSPKVLVGLWQADCELGKEGRSKR